MVYSKRGFYHRHLSTCIQWNYRLGATDNFIFGSGLTQKFVQVDGWLARKYNMQTVLGTILDPAADKTLMTTLTVSLAYKCMLPGVFCCLQAHLAAEFHRETSASGYRHPRKRRPSEPLSFLLSIYFFARTGEMSSFYYPSMVDQYRLIVRKPSSGTGIFRYLLRKCGQRRSANITPLSNYFSWDALPSAP